MGGIVHEKLALCITENKNGFGEISTRCDKNLILITFQGRDESPDFKKDICNL